MAETVEVPVAPAPPTTDALVIEAANASPEYKRGYLDAMRHAQTGSAPVAEEYRRGWTDGNTALADPLYAPDYESDHPYWQGYRVGFAFRWPERDAEYRRRFPDEVHQIRSTALEHLQAQIAA